MHGVLDALVTAAPADITRHRFADLVMRGFWIFCEQRSRLHDLTGLAITALGDVDLPPCFLNGVIAGRVVFSVPGSTAAVELAMARLILPELGHIVGLLGD